MDKLATFLVEYGLTLDKGQIESFEIFQEDLYACNETRNLTRVPEDECWVRHFADSLLFQDLFPVNASVLDIGTGPGFPAWPLACARQDLQVTALDSNGKMIAFLGRHKLRNMEIVQARAEDWDVREAFDFVTGRALAPLPAQLEISIRPCKIGGAVIPMRTLSDDLQPPILRALGLDLADTITRELPEGNGTRVMPVYAKRLKTNPKFPRSWADIKASLSQSSKT